MSEIELLRKQLDQAIEAGHLRVGDSGEWVYSHRDFGARNDMPELAEYIRKNSSSSPTNA